MSKTIVFVGGGSLGHVAKHIAVYPYIKNDFDKFIFIGSEGGLEKEYLKGRFPFEALPVAKFDRVHMSRNLTLPIDLYKAIKKAKAILNREEPAVIFCGGGFTCVPVAIAAKSLKIPVVLHESDYSLGLANRLSLPFCKRLLTTFEDTLKGNSKVEYCGAPIRRELLSANMRDALKKFGLSTDRRVLLVLGGSKGSQTINQAVECIYEKLLTEYNILHICGKENYRPSTVKGYIKIPFTDDMASVYACADIAVSRCGSNTAFELMTKAIPTVFIPLSKKASRGDQLQNAEYFLKRDLCRVLYEEALSPKKLLSEIAALERSGERLKNNMRNSSFANANEKIAEILRAYSK